MTKNFWLGILIFVAFWTSTAWAAATSTCTVSGAVYDDTGSPVVGASVVYVRAGVAVTGKATDQSGRFIITVPRDTGTAEIRISAVGYATLTVPAAAQSDFLMPAVSLASDPPDLGTIRVSPEKRPISADVTNAAELREHARTTLIPSDPISSVTGPSTARQGSSHSAQVRVDGTNPQYFLNDISIGTDPSHYGAFAVIPMPVINEMRFYAQGTPASFGTPSAVEFTTSDNFTSHKDGEVQLSTIDVTTRVSAGTSRFSLLGSVRKSVLDEIITQIQTNPDRRTIPPTSFLDMFLSTGWKLSPVYSVTIDQYHVRDQLSFNTAGATGQPYGVDTHQKTDGSYVGLRLTALYPSLLLRGSFGFQASRKEYAALPQALNTDHFSLDLHERRLDNTFSLSAAWTGGGVSFDAGTQGTYQSNRQISLQQEGWNFLPPFANSNNSYIYQDALNRHWTNFHGEGPSYEQAVYLSAERRVGKFTLQAGVRGEYFDALKEELAFVHRQSLAFQPSAQSNVALYHGTFAESPADNILEPYQVLVSARQAELSPVRTDLWSVDLTHRAVHLSIYHKEITNRPVVTPDYSQVDTDARLVSPSFLTVRSTGTATFVGGTATLNLAKFPGRQFDARLWYGYTRAEKTENGIAMAYELNAPHRFGSALDWRVSKRWLIGGEIQLRSGYPYTPAREARLVPFDEYYSPAYYRAEMASENSLRFPMNAFLNIHTGYTYGSGAVFLSISNVTNRANPIVNSSSGFIYDAGILPMVGLELHF